MGHSPRASLADSLCPELLKCLRHWRGRGNPKWIKSSGDGERLFTLIQRSSAAGNPVRNEWLELWSGSHQRSTRKSAFQTLKVFIQVGFLQAERLVELSRHNYRLEPNVSFTPDQKWVVFRSNMFGETYVFAVEVAKADVRSTAQGSR